MKRMADILSPHKIPSKCRFCGRSLTALSYPKYTGSDCVNHICLHCGAHWYGDYGKPPCWYTPKEWKEYVNAEVS